MPTICQILPETIRRNSGFRRKGIRPGKWKMRVEKMLQLTKMHVFNHEDPEFILTQQQQPNKHINKTKQHIKNPDRVICACNTTAGQARISEFLSLHF